ncbi:DUF636 domain protein, partial [Aureobasidium melanogenum]
MYTGSCFCKNIRIELSGQPQAIAICHCTDCRKISGSAYSYNFIVSVSDYKVHGSPAETLKTADSGNKVKNYYCKDCGSSLYGGAVAESGQVERVAMRAGVFDDLKGMQDCKPSLEIYTKQRLEWLKPIDGCMQFDGMPSF